MDRKEEKAKNPVRARDVADAAYRTIGCLKEACMNIPARVAAQLAIETDQARCYAILEAEFIAIFTDFAKAASLDPGISSRRGYREAGAASARPEAARRVSQ
jgi:hypothetical protein